MIRIKTVAFVTLALAAAACGATPTAGPTEVPVAATSAPGSNAPAKKVQAWGAGMYQVGTDIPAGSYKTRNEDKDLCYWERLRNDTGELDSIIANDMVTGPGRVTVKGSDKFVKFSGNCLWTKA